MDQLAGLLTPDAVEEAQQSNTLRRTLFTYLKDYPHMNDDDKVRMIQDIRSEKYQEQEFTLLRSELECMIAEDASLHEPYTYNPATNALVEELQKYTNTFSDMNDEERSAKYSRAIEIVQQNRDYSPINYEFCRFAALIRRDDQLKMILRHIDMCNQAFDSDDYMTKIGAMCYMKRLVEDVFIEDEQYVKAIEDLQEKVANSAFMRQLEQSAE